LDAQVKNSMSDQGPNATADNGVSTSRSGKGPNGPADAEVSKSPFAQGLDENAMTADEEMVFMILFRCQGYRSEHVKNLLKIQVKVWTPQVPSGHHLWKSKFV
jgi:hypothetical protein